MCRRQMLTATLKFLAQHLPPLAIVTEVVATWDAAFLEQPYETPKLVITTVIQIEQASVRERRAVSLC